MDHILRLIATKMWSLTCECGPTTFSVLYSDGNVVHHDVNVVQNPDDEFICPFQIGRHFEARSCQQNGVLIHCQH